MHSHAREVPPKIPDNKSLFVAIDLLCYRSGEATKYERFDSDYMRALIEFGCRDRFDRRRYLPAIGTNAL